MKSDQLDTYVIPPNFIEGGTLMGGMFKTRNAIEAGILGLAVGVPVFHINASLTARIIILCLTALPLMLFALIGVGGMSLSAFVRLLFQFVRNRRLLTRNTDEGNGKSSLLTNWGRQNRMPEQAEQTDTLPKSRNRFQLDLKAKQVQQYKVFLSPEDNVKPLNALASYVPIQKIVNGVILTRDHRYVKVVEVIPHPCRRKRHEVGCGHSPPCVECVGCDPAYHRKDRLKINLLPRRHDLTPVDLAEAVSSRLAPCGFRLFAL